MSEKIVKERRPLSLYVHIPFCKAKCNYCDFLSFAGMDFSKQKQYVNALVKELKAYEVVADEYVIQTIFIGGGTPSYMDASLLVELVNTIRDVFEIAADAEITMEGNPDSLTTEELAVCKEVGINRLSIGLQSANDALLKCLMRVHNYDQFVAAFNSARKAGFNNINIDIMSGLPGETMDSYIETLGKVVDMQPEHISAYSLIVEEGTPLSQNEELLSYIPSEELDRKMYARTKQLLKNSGYDRYEISNYAKEGFSCKHNLVYWTGGEYLGVGLGASSYLQIQTEQGKQQRVRFHGVEDFDEYIGRFMECESAQGDAYTDMYFMVKGIEGTPFLDFLRDYYKDLYFLKRKDEMEEFMFLGLRLANGIDKQLFYDRFGVAIESVYGTIIDKYVKQQLIDMTADRLFLTDKGVDVSNVVMAEFML